MTAAAPPPRALLPPPSAEEEARAFWQLRTRIARTLIRQSFQRARLRMGLVIVLSAGLWLSLFWMFADGFAFLQSTIAHQEIHDQTVRAVFAMFFFALMVMLIFSSGIILYGSLFRGADTALLLSIPARSERIFLHKFQESVLWSSWAFLLLSSPLLLAYGMVAKAPWYYYAMLPAFLLAFTYIPAGLGALGCLGLVYRFPRTRLHVLVLSAAAILAAAVWFTWSSIFGTANELLTPTWLQEVLGRLSLAEGRLLPNWWLSAGLLEAARDTWSESLLFLVVLTSNALLLRQAAVWMAGRVYRPAYNSLYVHNPRRRRARPVWFDRLLLEHRWLLPLPLPMRLLVVKDFRLFRRDPVQWSQFLIFFGLLVLYFVNIRRFSHDVYHVAWVNMISFLNLAVVGLLMSTFTTRFIFPMISLEGRRFWILGLLPVRRETILWSKFLFAAGGSIVPCAGLILLSDAMLRVAPVVAVVHQIICALLCLGLSGIAVGLGARLPSLREQSPSRIAAGFGGTLNLVVSTLYIVAVVLLTALPCHFFLVMPQARAALEISGVLSAAAADAPTFGWLKLWLAASVAGSMVLGAMATIVPLAIGFRAFRRMEF